MTMLDPSPFLRRMLILDACLTGVTAVLLITGAGMLDEPLGFPAAFLRAVGLCLVPFTALLLALIRRNRFTRGAAWFVVVCNALWAVDSILLLFSGWVDPTWFGRGFVMMQAVVVAVFAELQYVALRKSSAIAS